MANARRRRFVGPLLGLVLALAALPLMRTPLFLGFEQKTVDARLRWRGPAPVASEIVVVAIDASSIDRLGQWPWPRTTIAELITRLKQDGARIVALDVLFSEPARCGVGEDQALAAAITDAGCVIPGFFLRERVPGSAPVTGPLPAPIEQATVPPDGFPAVARYDDIEVPLPAIVDAAPQAGHFVTRPDSDGTVRHYPLILFHRDQLYPALALRAVQRFRGDAALSVVPRDGVIPVLRLGAEEIPTSEGGELWINFRGPFGATFPYVAAADLLEGKVPRGTFAEKLVFLGATETGLSDIETSPFDAAVPGVEVHATVADNLLHRRYLRDGAVETMISMLATILLGVASGAAAGGVRRSLNAALLSLAVLVGYVVLAQLALTILARHLHLFVPLTVGLLAFTATAVWRNVFAEARTREIRRAFQRYVSPAIVDELLEDPDKLRLGGERRELTVLFADIRGFTHLAERMPPEGVVTLLNEFFTPMTEIIQSHGGTIDKYMGDALMAVFGAPLAQADHAVRAAESALAMRGAMDALSARWSARGWDTVRAGIGLNSGPMAVGNMGSATIFDYTVIGDEVNLGARLQELTRVYGVDLVASESTVAQIPPVIARRELDRVRVRGRREVVRVYELLPDGALPDEFLALFEQAVETFHTDRFSEAKGMFETLLELRPGDGPTQYYLARLVTELDEAG